MVIDPGLVIISQCNVRVIDLASWSCSIDVRFTRITDAFCGHRVVWIMHRILTIEISSSSYTCPRPFNGIKLVFSTLIYSGFPYNQTVQDE